MSAREVMGITVVAFICAAATWGCGSQTSDAAAPQDGGPEDGADSESSSPHSDSDTLHTPDVGPDCPPLPAPDGNIVSVGPADADALQGIVQSAASGDTILLEDGTYPLNGAYLWFGTPSVSLRSASGDRESVVLDGNYDATEIITVAASNVTIADLTLTRAYTHPIHVISTDEGDTVGTLIYNVHIIDPREQAIKINPHEARTYYPDDGTIACTHIELTDDGRPNVNPTSGGCYTGGVDAHDARGWIIRDNTIEGFFCPDGLSEHAVHLWRGCRDTLVERNLLVDNARGIGFGLSSSGDARTYDDAPCDTSAYVGHYGGIIRNNVIYASNDALFASATGFDCGICLWSACGATVAHNTLFSFGDNFSSIEWRFEGSRDITITNNIASHPLRERDGAAATQTGNLEEASSALFVDAAGGDFHLARDADQAIDRGAPLNPGVCDEDMDADPRDDTPDIGADEVR